MATTDIKSSSTLRTTIGQIRRRLEEALESYGSYQKMDHISSLPYPKKLDTLDHAELLISTIDKYKARYLEHAAEWDKLVQRDPGEAQVRDKYYEKYGAFEPLLQRCDLAKNSLNELISILKAQVKLAVQSAETYVDMPSTQPVQTSSDVGTLHVPLSQNSLATILTSNELLRTDVRPFSGNIGEFQNFKELFTSTFDQEHIRFPQRMAALKNLTRNIPFTMISSLPLNSTGYETAWKLLNSFYGHSTTNLRVLLQRMQEIPPCEGKDAIALQSTFASCFALVQQLKQYQSQLDAMSISLAILKKFPRTLTSKIQHNSEVTSNPEQLLNEICTHIQSELRLDSLYNNSANTPVQTFSVQRTSGRQTIQARTCPFCQLNHTAFGCPLSPSDKLSVCKQQRMCQNCLKPGHYLQSCPSTKNCQSCNRRHHTSLHRDHQASTPFRATAPQFNGRQQAHNATAQHWPQRNSQSPRNGNARHYDSRYNNGNRNFQFAQAPLPNNAAPRPNNTTSNQSSLQHSSSTAPLRMNQPRNNFGTPRHTLHQAITTDQSAQQQENDDTAATAITMSTMTTQQASNNDFAISPTKQRSTVPLLCLRIQVRNPALPEKMMEANAFLDTGSTASFISKELAKQLELPTIRTTTLDIETFGKNDATTQEAKLYHVELLPQVQPLEDNHDDTCFPLDVYSIQQLTNEIDTIRPVDWPQGEATQAISLVHERIKPDLLLGTNVIWPILNIGGKDFASYNIHNYQVLHTRLGPLVVPNHHSIGQKLTSVYKNKSNGNNSCLQNNPDLSDEDKQKMSVEDQKCYDFFRETVKYDPDKKRYSVRWPMKTESLVLPESRHHALRRQCFVFRQLEQKGALPNYMKYFHEMSSLDVIEQVPEEEYHNDRQNYLLHFAVFKENSLNTKIRPVFNASATYGTFPSLNSQMHRGPLFNSSIWEILIRCRLPAILLTCDIAKAFLMVALQTIDKDLCRFLLPANLQQPFSRFNCVDYRFKRMPFGPTASPSLLNCVIKAHLEKYHSNEKYKKLALEIEKTIYVDNIFIASETIEEAQDKFHACNAIFAEAGMRVREWSSNNDTLNKYFEACDLDNKTPSIGKILGLKWNKINDNYGVQPNSATSTTQWTRRKVLQFTNGTFDPIGFLLPLTTTCKIFLQSLCRKGYSFDELIKADENEQWNDIVSHFISEPLWIPRRLPQEHLYLHIFCDASQLACAAVAYVTTQSLQPQLIAAVSRVAPLTNITIPKLELNSLLMGARLAKKIKTILPPCIDNITIWSDASIALFWLTVATEKQPVYVKNRVEQIREITKTTQAKFRHTPGRENPADIATRPINGHEFSTPAIMEKWLHGPSFLMQPPEQWPTLPVDNTPEITTMTIKAREAESISHFIDYSRYSTFTKLLNIICFIITFLRSTSKGRVPHGINIKSPEQDTVGFSTAIRDAANLAICYLAQQDVPPTELDRKRYHMYQEEHGQLKIWRCGTRTRNVTGDPIWLPSKHPTTRLRILQVHQNNFHCNVTLILSELRQHYFIQKARGTIKQALLLCFACRRTRHQHFQLPEFPLLPTTRLIQPHFVFESTGIDYAGPITTLVEGQPQKAWIALATCFSTRYTYCEVVSSLDTFTFILFIRRLSALFGYPRHILCDNQRSFIAAAEFLSPKGKTALQQFANKNTCQFTFTAPHAPWQGGLYERLIGLLKQALRNSLRNKVLEISELQTIDKLHQQLRAEEYKQIPKDNFISNAIDFVKNALNYYYMIISIVCVVLLLFVSSYSVRTYATFKKYN